MGGRAGVPSFCVDVLGKRASNLPAEMNPDESRFVLMGFLTDCFSLLSHFSLPHYPEIRDSPYAYDAGCFFFNSALQFYSIVQLLCKLNRSNL